MIYTVNYVNVISLGYFCSVASELEKLGLRNFSSPFDWCISDFKGILNCLENYFEDFLSIENMCQKKEEACIYKDTKYNIEFFHDFNNYEAILIISLQRLQQYAI